METLVIKYGKYTIEIKDVIYKELFKIFPNFEGLVDVNNILEMQCFKLTNEQLFTSICGICCLINEYKDLTNIKLDVDKYSFIKYIFYDKNKKDIVSIISCAHEVLILMEYFACEISQDIIFCLYHCCIKDDIKLDNSVVSYIEEKAKYIICNDKYEKYMILMIIRKFMVSQIVKGDDLIKKLKEGFIQCVEYIDNDIRYVYYPKEDKDNIEKIILLNKHTLKFSYKHKFMTNGMIDYKAGIDYGGLYTIFNGRKLYTKLQGFKIHIFGGTMSFNLDNEIISIISIDELHRIAFNPTLEEVTEIFRDIILKS
ncbi:Hypothetical protein ORPV_118 [Orpheovirus IHUMI-LCC2]|uniref:Uncharacterized protein n=1 Tax=Orpheovirus IHUMI-LCC2 TaxID=2023057 RepID=A0A2I2L3A6_9VIRU|nr:Hypothetical protein ORPV_118 [Orpheovirus IHUMI-LCC2]SNW62022.1 Hypothetical protein ORPV_118 [Orpheovirus IHUMI-LCC2]